MPGDQATSQYPIAQVVYNFTYFFVVESGQTSEVHFQDASLFQCMRLFLFLPELWLIISQKGKPGYYKL